MDKVKTFVIGCVEWINKYRAYGWAVFILIALLILLFGGNCYAILQNEDRFDSYKTEQENVHERMIQRVDNIEVRLDSMRVHQKVMESTLNNNSEMLKILITK